MAAVNGVNGHTNDIANGVNGQYNGNSPRDGRSKSGAVGPEGYPKLPPITKPNIPQREDPYAKSKLMKFRLANHKQALLMQVL